MTIAKALVAAAIAGVAALTTGAVDGHLELAEYLVAAGAALTALGGVFYVPNKQP